MTGHGDEHEHTCNALQYDDPQPSAVQSAAPRDVSGGCKWGQPSQ